MTTIGDVIDGRYTVRAKIGEGGMSEVWLAEDARLGRMQAVKEIKKNAKTETHHVLVDRIKVEAEIMKGLDHPNIVKVNDYIDDGTSLYIVMDYIQGHDLREIMYKHLRVITEDNVFDWGMQLCDALNYLHQQGIIYRDMKPGNVMLLEDGTVKIIDFGIARIYDPAKEHDTMPLGTRGYASPEAFKKGAQTTAQSDIYSLGVTLFHLVTGHGPLEYVDRPSLPPIRELNPALSPAMESIIMTATDWDPQKRYPSCAAMYVALEERRSPEDYEALRRRFKTFRGLLIAGFVCLLVGAGTMVASNMVRSASYDGLMSRALVASAEEVDGQASEAEQLYMQAIELNSENEEPYDRLINDVYKADSSFSTTEASRWTQLLRDNRGALTNKAWYAQLCYDTGIDYFLYYDYGNGDALIQGEQSVTWFNEAMTSYDANPGASTLSADDRSSAEMFATIGGFSNVITQATAEGRERDYYPEYWSDLETLVNKMSGNSDESMAAGSTIARLRVCTLVVRAVEGYATGFKNSGITQTQMMSLLNQVEELTGEMEEEASSSDTTQALYDDLLARFETARAKVNSTYNNAASQFSTGTPTEGGNQ